MSYTMKQYQKENLDYVQPLTVSIKGIAKMLNISECAVYGLRKQPNFPKRLPYKRNYLQFDANEVKAWYQSQLDKRN